MMCLPHDPKRLVWLNLFQYDELSTIIETGRMVGKFRDQITKDYCKSYGFETGFDGYKCFAVNLYMFGSQAFGSLINKYDICISFVFNGKNWQVGLYSEKIHVGKLAKKWGGGGHTGAAGFVIDKLPFF
jgi:hypothetical protein